MNVGGGWEKELRELHRPPLDEKAVPKDKIVGEERGVLEEDELQMHGIDEDVKDVRQGVDQVDAASQTPQQQPLDDSVCWERFLHLRSIKVLLVENDDSTRHIVTALLRNCSYEVIEAANALQAWKILEDLTNHIDLVLTEVVMPCLSGISLLCKIMSHRTRCNLPVIMMSSNDPMSLVFKCLSKGAVDFLVKPIRKNELKNLWQHVWRRCHSSCGSGSGSGSGSQTQKSVKSKSVEKCEINSCSNDGDDNESIGLNVGGRSDNGSGTQSSWTKQAAEVDSPREKSLQNQIDECPESTCALVVHSNAETSGTKLVPVTKTRKGHENKEELVMPEGVVTITGQSLMDGTEVEAPNRSFDISHIHSKATNNTEPQTSLHPSSKGLAATKDLEAAVQDDRNVLKHSELSAFSRYRAVSNAYNSPTGNIGSSSSRGLSLNNFMKQSLHEIQSHSSVNPPNQCSNEVSNKIDRGSTTNNASAKCVVMNKSAMTFSAKHLHPSSAFHPVEEDYSCSPHQGMLDNVNELAATKILAQQRGTHKELQNELLLHHYNHHHHLVCNSEQHLPLDRDDLSSKKMAVAAPHCGLSYVLSVPFKGNALYNVGGSASNDGQSGNKLAVNAGGPNIESDDGISGKSVNASGSESGSGNRVDNKMFARREAALTKFRQKRKERYFRKKVQHQSRTATSQSGTICGASYERKHKRAK